MVTELQSLVGSTETNKRNSATGVTNELFHAAGCLGFSFQKVYLGHSIVEYNNQCLIERKQKCKYSSSHLHSQHYNTVTVGH